MNRVIAVIAALLAAVHVSVPALGLPAPVPVLMAFAAVITGLCWLIAETAYGSGVALAGGKVRAAPRTSAGNSFDCGNGLHAPLCAGCGCDCHDQGED